MSARILLIGSAFLVASCATAQENPNYQYSSKYGTTQVANNAGALPQGVGQQSTTGNVYSANAQTNVTHTHAGDGVTHAHPMEAGHSLTQGHAIQSSQMNTGYVTQSDQTRNTGYVGNEGTMIQAAHPIENNASPTEGAYDASRMQGTPGYEMMRAQQNNAAPAYPTAPAPLHPNAPAPDYTPYVPPVTAQQTAPAPFAAGPRPIPYDYSQNMVANDTAPTRQTVPNYNQSYDRGQAGIAANIGTGQSYVVRQGDTVYGLSRRLCAPIPEITSPNGIDGSYKISIGQTLTLPNSRC